MKSIPNAFIADFAQINRVFDDLASLIKSEDNCPAFFPRKKIIEQGLEAEFFRVYLFDAMKYLVMFIPQMSFGDLFNKLIPFEERYALSEEDSSSSMREYVEYGRKQLRYIEDKTIELEDAFFIAVFGDNILLRIFDIGSTEAVVFALLFAALNVYEYSGDGLSLEDASNAKDL